MVAPICWAMFGSGRQIGLMAMRDLSHIHIGAIPKHILIDSTGYYEVEAGQLALGCFEGHFVTGTTQVYGKFSQGSDVLTEANGKVGEATLRATSPTLPFLLLPQP
jgi:hypothetical protein